MQSGVLGKITRERIGSAMNYREGILEVMESIKGEDSRGISTNEIADRMKMQRTNASAILNDLYREGLLEKISHKPVLYGLNRTKKMDSKRDSTQSSLDRIIGSDKTLKKCVQQAKAAILYPPHGLHTIIVGSSGVGKTMFAELMHKYAIESGRFDGKAPFEVFNCADYANNSELLLAHLFGCKKGAFTGADRDREGIVAKADGGILFLDEVHRLPPEGQEMFFYLIDKGLYTPLGEENYRTGNLFIICATTENIDEALLQTFTRRIPMNIQIPSLMERTQQERFDLIGEFFRNEAIRIKREISVSANSIRQLLLYESPGNVGQLKSDIQLGCANAFLNAVSTRSGTVHVHCTDFSSNVNMGLLTYKDHWVNIDRLVKEGELLKFAADGVNNFPSTVSRDVYSVELDFYENIEVRVQELQDRGMDEKEVRTIMETEIGNYFKNFIRNFNQEIRKDELSKIVDLETIGMVEDFLQLIGGILHRIFPIKIFYGLALHLSSSIERLRQGKPINLYNLSKIKKDHPEEFELSRMLAEKVEKSYDIVLPEDEIGFITMFLTIDEMGSRNLEDKPVVVITMHGKSTASSMAEVVNSLVKADNVYAYDMALDKEPDLAYRELKNLIVKKDQGAGVILLVDMGSLSLYGELISGETGIEIRTIPMVSTAIALECSRKAVVDSDIHAICETVKADLETYYPSESRILEYRKPIGSNLIITLCMTGEGGALMLKNFIESKVDLGEYDVRIIPMAWNNQQYAYHVLRDLAKQNNILAIVGTIDPEIFGIPYLSTYDLFQDKACDTIKGILDHHVLTPGRVQGEEAFGTFIDSLRKEIHNLDLSEYESLYKSFMVRLNQGMELDLEYEVSIGLMIHMICGISRMVENKPTPICSTKEELREAFVMEFQLIKASLEDIEKYYAITFNDDEVAFILKNIKKI